MSTRVHIDLDVPPELVEAIADEVAMLLASRLEEPDKWLSATEAAEYLRCGVSRVYALSSARRIPLHRDGSRLLFRRSELDIWVKAGGGKRFA
jgi:excisionase family DNA binding protein